MSSDATTGATKTASGATTPVNLAEASRRILEEGFNEGKLDLADELISAQAINHDPAEPATMRGLRGPEVFKQTVRMYRSAFPDVRITVDDVIAADDKVVLRWHSEGTHRGELEGLARPDDEVRARSDREPMVAVVAERTRRTRVDAIRAEDAAAEIEQRPGTKPFEQQRVARLGGAVRE